MFLKQHLYASIILYFCLSFFSQNIYANSNKFLQNINDSWAQEQLSNLSGIWSKDGYAEILEISATTVNSYSVSDVHCIQAFSITIEEASALLPYVFVNPNRDQFKTDPNLDLLDTHSYSYGLITELPLTCTNGINQSSMDPIENFQVFWHTFNKHYAFFDLRNVDWQQLYDDSINIVQQLDQTPESQEVLFGIMSQLILSLDRDGHSSLSIEDEDNPENSIEVSALSLRGLERRLLTEFQSRYSDAELLALFNEQSEIESFEDFVEFAYARFTDDIITEHREIILSYMVEGSYHIAAAGNIRWGKLENNIGYLEISDMAEFTTNPDATPEDILQALDSAMNQAMLDLKTTQALVIDVRLNGGGIDKVSYLIAQRFFDEERLVFTKKARNGNTFVNEVEIILSPVTDSYIKPVYLLIGPATVSAAEVFTSAMTELPHVKTIGENTNGIFSDTIDMLLPNGWEISVSNEVYLNSKGESNEYNGITPDFQAILLDKISHTKGIDSALEKVVQMEAGGFIMQAAHSALWYNPEESGHGITVNMLANNRIIVTWFVYDNQGNQAWLIGVGTHDGMKATLDVTVTSGAMFPPNFSAGDVNLENWGQFELEFSGCNDGLFKWFPVAGNEFMQGETNVVRLNNTLGLTCIE